MSGLKSLAKDTAIYGISSIVGRFLNYLLVHITACLYRWLWNHYEYVRHYGTSVSVADVRDGNWFFPLCQ